jgi:hypothetical protein
VTRWPQLLRVIRRIANGNFFIKYKRSILV